MFIFSTQRMVPHLLCLYKYVVELVVGRTVFFFNRAVIHQSGILYYAPPFAVSKHAIANMLKRKKHIYHNFIRFNHWERQITEKRTTKAILKNFFLTPLNRLSTIFDQPKFRHNHSRYSSMSKLQCPWSYSFSVPNKKLKGSRFFLNRAVDQLVYPFLQK